jgi:predicted alpha-1,2-mannosidase
MFSIRLPQLGKVWSKTKSIMPLALMCISAFQTFAQKTEVDYVNPYMGNISHLLVPTFPTVHLPNSLLRVYPERGDYTSDRINGLPLIVTSHRGSSAFNLSPLTSGSRELEPVINYSYDQETINPYSYSVYLDQDNIQVDFAVSHQSAIYELNFEKEGTPQIIFNTRKGDIKWDGKGLSGSQDIGNNTKVYLYAEFQKHPAQIGSIKNGKISNNSESSGENANLILTFPNGTKSVSVRYGISFIDAAQAKANVNREIKDFDLAKIKEIGKQTWNKALGKLKVEGNNENDKNIFYTSLYRTFERPVNISEDGRYFSAFDGKVHNDEGTPFFTDDWIWDSYRAHHPLNVLIDT